LSNWFVVISNPALYALINGLITRAATTLRNRIPIYVSKLTLTPAASALIHKATGTNVNKTINAIIINAIIIIGKIDSISIITPHINWFYFFLYQYILLDIPHPIAHYLL